MRFMSMLIGWLFLAPAPSANGQNLDGIWQSRGYAMLLDVEGDTLNLFQVTRSTLIPLDELILDNGALQVDRRTTLLLSRVGESLRVTDPDETVNIEFVEVHELPPVTGFDADPVANFDMLAELFTENYALFDVNGIDWQQTVADARPRVNPATSDDDLFDLFVEMLRPLNDRHTRLNTGRRFFISGPVSDPFWTQRKPDILDNLAATYLDNATILPAHMDDRISFGTIDGEILYLLIDSFVAAGANQPLQPDTLDAVFSEHSEVRGIIVDLRFNGGGRESNGIALLDRLTDRPRVAVVRETRSILDQGFTPLETILTQPDGVNLGGRPVVILTSGETASTGDAVALTGAYLPWVAQVGATTKGVLSGNLGLILANGWALSLSHQRNYSPAGEFLEQKGVAPDIQSAITPADLDAGRDPMLEAALTHLNKVPVPQGTSVAVDAAISGVWFDPEHAGEGWIVEVLPDSRTFLTWFSYGHSAAPPQAWMTGVGVVEGSRLVVEEMQITGGARFGESFDPDDVRRQPWGRIEFHFESCDSGFVVYEGPAGFRAGVQRLVRLAAIDGLECGGNQTTDPASAVRFTGSWFDPDRSGEGWMLSVLSDRDAFVAWFTYDADGNQAWIVGSGAVSGQVIDFPELVRPVGAVFGPAFDPGTVDRQPWGTMQFRFTGCDSLQVEFQSEQSAFSSGQRDAIRLTSPAGVLCSE